MARGASDAIAVVARAKINLALHVRARRADGYHAIETIFAFADDGDRLRVEPAADLSLEIVGPFAAGLSVGDDNLVLRAAMALRAAVGKAGGARIRLDKRLPVAAGIGGGSADAAATLVALSRLWGVPDLALAARVAPTLGADVPACLAGGITYGSGVGDVLEPIDAAGIAGTPILLANPRRDCPTGPVFAGWDGVDRGPLDQSDWAGGRNDLTASAIRQVPAIADLLALLAETGAEVVRMSGSGATCFATYRDVAGRNAAAAAIGAAMPEAWLMPSRIAT